MFTDSTKYETVSLCVTSTVSKLVQVKLILKKLNILWEWDISYFEVVFSTLGTQGEVENIAFVPA